VIHQSVLAFQEKRIAKLESLGVKALVTRKNPYLFAAAGFVAYDELAAALAEAALSSSDETLVGNEMFEPIARAACQGTASSTEGIDIEWERAGRIALIAVKSGVSVFNSSSKKKADDFFRRASRVLRQRPGGMDPDMVVGYAYGKKAFRGETYVFRELAGAEFWEWLTGDSEFYRWLFDEIARDNEGYRAQYETHKAEAIQRVASELAEVFGHVDGHINWHAILEVNSGPR